MNCVTDFPRLRRVDLRASGDGEETFDVFDPSGLAPDAFRVSAAALDLMLRMNGRNDRAALQVSFLRRHGRMLHADELEALIQRLDEGLFLEGPRFEAYWEEMLARYRALPARPLREPHSFGAPAERLGEYLDAILSAEDRHAVPPSGDEVRGLVAPHLDYERGAPCYASAYRELAERSGAVRFVVLGTNHYGRCPSVVGTRKDFETPLGLVPHDAEFMRRIDERLGVDLCAMELDHVREHSVELQAIVLRHVLGDRDFQMAAYLCPDPCVAEWDGEPGRITNGGPAADLRAFAAALKDEIDRDGVPTCIIAGADLSHVGRYFQDERELNADELHYVEALDRGSLAFVEADDAEGFRSDVAARDNSTNICSVGCIFTLATILAGSAKPRLLNYHQALTPEIENCVTSCAMEWV